MGADKPHDQGAGRGPEQNPKRQTNAALEEIGAQFADAETGVLVRLAERLAQLKQLSGGVCELFAGQGEKPLLHVRVDDQRFFQEPPPGYPAAS